MLRVYEELSRDWSVCSSVMFHNDLIIKSIQLFGTDEQKNKYLPRLANGSITGAFCLHEDNCGQDIAAIKTNAKYIDNQSATIILNGKKTWITNADNADILIVFAKLHHQNDLSGIVIEKYRFFCHKQCVSKFFLSTKFLLRLLSSNVTLIILKVFQFPIEKIR